VEIQDVEEYFQNLRTALSVMRTPAQLLNMDETGFAARPWMGKKKEVVYALDCKVGATWRQKADQKHVSLVATIALSPVQIKPMFLVTSAVTTHSSELKSLAGYLELYHTERGYQNEHSMAFYIEKILKPYCDKLRKEMNDPDLPIFLIMDNCSSHNRPALLGLYAAYNIKVIWLPAHSSHFLQPLDLALFANLKRNYLATPNPFTKPKWEGKVVGAYRAWYETQAPPATKKSWTAGAICFDDEETPKWWPDEERVTRKLERECQNNTQAGNQAYNN
jgi:hypothetical protein